MRACRKTRYVIRISRGQVFVVLLLVGGCRHKSPPPAEIPWRWAAPGTSCGPNARPFPLPESLRDTTIHPFGSPTHSHWEDRATITRGIPGGFGGISWREKDPRTVVYLLDTTQLAAAVPALVSVGVLPPNPRVGAIPGRFTYAQLYDWMSYIHMHLRGVRLAGWAIDEKNNRIIYFLADEASVTELNRNLAEMHAPCFLIAFLVTGPARALSGAH